MIVLELFARWLMIGALAFGGGQAALSLVERTVVVDAGWLSPQDLAAGIAFAFMTPGPVLILAPFVGFRVAGVAGAIGAALGVFLIPWFLATAAAHVLQRFAGDQRLRAFGRGAAPAVVALLALSALDIGRESFVGWPTIAIALAALVATTRRVHPSVVLSAGAIAGFALDAALASR